MMMREPNLDRLGDWMHQATATGITALKSLSWVCAAISLPSMPRSLQSGAAARSRAQIHRLKLIKRQMYGRAGFALLRRRVLPFVADEERRAP